MQTPLRTRPPPTHRAQPRLRFSALVVVLVLVTAVVWAWRSDGFGLLKSSGAGKSASTGTNQRASHAAPSTNATGPSSFHPTTLQATPGPINTKYPGLTTFRGNATRDYYGTGPVPSHPVIRWRYPKTGGLC